MNARLFPAALFAVLGVSWPAHAQSLRIVANEYAFATPRAARPGINRIVLVNKGKELHHIIMMRLPDSLDASSAYKKLIQREPLGAGAHGVGGPAAIAPGDSSIAWADLDAGRYLLICFIPSPDKTPHAMKGMFVQLDVSGDPVRTRPPAATLTLSATEYALSFSAPPAAGSAVVEFRNSGAQEHDYVIIRLPASADPVETARRLGRADTTLKDVRLVGGSGPLGPGRRGWNRVSFSSGHYAVLCYVSDEKDGRSHYLHGMVKTFDVP